MAKLSDRNMLGWVNRSGFTEFPTGMDTPLPESTEDSKDEVLLSGNQSPRAFPFSSNKKLLGTMAASVFGSVFGVTAILFFFHHQTIPQVEAVNSLRSVVLISELSRAPQAPMPQVHVLDQTFVKILRVPGATEVVSLKVQPRSTRLSQNPILK